jgi:hypothetical protein
MGELARRLDARDLWISRGHVWAAGLGAAFVAVIAFSVGVLVGSGEPAHASGVDPLGLSQAPDDSLVELLARVEASADPTGGVSALTFPDALRGVEQPDVPRAPAAFSGAATIDAGVAEAPVADAPPAGAFTIVVSRTSDEQFARAQRDQLRARDLPVWLDSERVGGEPAWRVCLGGYPTAEDASADLAAYGSVLPVVAAAVVEPLQAEVRTE